MVWIKRLLLVVMVFALPALLTWASSIGVQELLVRTHRIIDPQILRLAGYAEFAALFFIALLEARARWAARPSH